MFFIGGFKAKLKGNRKKEKEPTVVCVKYNFFSEFDTPQSLLPSTSYRDIGRNEVVKERKVLPKPNVEDMFKKKPESGSAKSNGEIVHIESKPEKPKTKNKKKNATKTNKTPQSKKETVETEKIPKKATKEKKSPKTKPQQSRVEAKKVVEEPKKLTKQKSATKIVAETPDLTTSFERGTPEENIYAEYDDGNFQIHVANHDKFYTNLSEDETSEFGEIQDDFVIKPGMSPLNFSSQATSIFFGGEDEEPVVSRPRNIIINDDDATSHGSSASA